MNEILIKVRVDDESAAGYAAALAAGKTFGDQLESELNQAGHSAGREAGNGVADELNRQLRALRLPELDVDVQTMDAREHINEIERRVRELAADSPTIDVKIRSDKALSELSAFKRRFKEIEDDGNKNGDNWAVNFIKNAAAKLGGSSGLSSVLIPLGISLAPLIGGSIAGAIVGGVGLGGIVGGIALAVRDERTQFALLDLSDNIQSKLSDAIDPFVKATVSGIDQVSEHLDRIDFKGIFSDLAPQLAPITNGVTDLIDSLGKAIRDVVAKSGPVISVIGQEIGDIGRVLAHGFEMFADNSGKAAKALHDLFALINGSIEVVFAFVNALTEVYDVFHKMIDLSPWGVYEMIHDKQLTVKDSAVEMAQALIKSTEATDDSTTSTELATQALKAQDDAIHEVSNSLKASTDPLFAFMDAQDELTAKENAMNKAIKQHGQNSKEAQAATRDYQKSLINYISSAAAATNGTGHLTAEQKRLLASAGTSKRRIQELDNALYKAWKSANKLDGFEIDITVKQRFVQTGKYISNSQIANPTQLYSGLAHGGIAGAASGATSSGLTWTGEYGAELLDLPPGTSVRTHGDSMRDAQKMAMGSAAQSIVVQFMLDGKMMAEALVDPIRGLVGSRGRGSVQQLLGKPGVAR